MTGYATLLGERNPLRRRRTGSGVGPRRAVTFPTTPLNFRVQIGLSLDYTRPWWEWNWTDITQYVRWTPTIAWATGRPDEASSVDTGTGALTLDNTDGRFSRRNPYGPYFGQLTKNTPIWVQADPGSGFVTLLQHYVNEWPSRWDQSRNDVTVPIATAGILRRLQQGSVVKSPLRAALPVYDPLAYWPMEDGTDSTFIASGLVGGTNLTLFQSAYIAMADDSTCVGSLPNPLFTASSNTVAGRPSEIDLQPLGMNATKVSVACEFTAYMPSTPVSTLWNLFGITCSGSSSSADPQLFVQVYAGTSSGVRNLIYGIDAYDPTNRGATTSGLDPFDGAAHSLLCTWEQVAGNVIVTLYVDGVLGTQFTNAGTMGTPTKLTLLTPKGGILTDTVNNTGSAFALGHVAVWASGTPLDPYQASIGYTGEQAHARIQRICGQESIPFTAGAGPSVAMGPQPIATALEIFRDCELADLGSLYEVAFGLGYQSNTQRDNASVKLTLDMDQGHVSTPPEPTDDDQGLINKFTASRSGGSEATYEKTTGPLGTGTGGPGLYDDSATPNVQLDTQLFAYASARVNRGTVDEDRWPSVPMNFAAAPSLIPTWTGMEPFGARINITHPPTQMAPDTIDAFIDGYSVAVTPIDWDVAINTSPGSPHRVFVLAGPSDDTNPNLGYMVPTTCVLAEDLDTTETGVDITTTPLWSTTAEDWTPGALITVDGEDMTVTAVSGGSNPQTLTVTRSVNSVVKTHTSGATVAFKFPGNLGL